MDPFSRGRTHSHELESPMTNEDIAQFLPGYLARQRAEEAENIIPEEKKPEKPLELTEEEKLQILAKNDFQVGNTIIFERRCTRRIAAPVGS